jgi:hypothetical protein
MALMQTHQSNEVLEGHFADQPSVSNHFSKFESIVEKSQLLQYADSSDWGKLIGENIHPVFSEW